MNKPVSKTMQSDNQEQVLLEAEIAKAAGLGKDMMALMARLFPICRTLTGSGIRETFDILGEKISLTEESVASGTKVFDWTVPDEWAIRDAYIADADGNRVIDFKNSNLHVVHYSIPVHKHLTLQDLRPHLHTAPDLPDAIPYVTSYYKRDWGFCLSETQLNSLEEGQYEVMIDSTLEPGRLEWREAAIGPEGAPEVLFSTYCCHPSMANNELSGPVLQTFLCESLSGIENLRYRYRFVFLPETIGAIAYLAKHGDDLRERCVAGYELTCAGDNGPFTYKKSRQGVSLADRAAQHVFSNHLPEDADKVVHDYFPDAGANERQYNSPGFNLPVGSFMRSMYGEYPEYHTSFDNLDFVSAEGMAGSLVSCLRIVQAIELNARYLNTQPNGEPQLGKRGLYVASGIHPKFEDDLRHMLYLLCYCDGESDLLSISEKLECPISQLQHAVLRLANAGLLVPVERSV